jgi:hypothetical protein
MITYEGLQFENETALHEWLMEFDFYYFMDFISQN